MLENILIIKLRYIGDVLLSTPVITQLRRAFPQAKITMLVNPGTEEILKNNQFLDEVLVLEKGGITSQAAFCLNLRLRRFDCVIDLTDGDRSAILSSLTGAPVRVGFNEERRWRGSAYTNIATPGPQDRHRIERDLSSLRPLGLSPEPGLPVLLLSEDEKAAAQRGLADLGIKAAGTFLIMVQPGARYWFKAWPPERFVELVNRLVAETACHVLVGGSLPERELVDKLVSKTQGQAVSLAGRVSVRQYAAILKHCSLFIGNDAGPMHMAAALGVPVLGLFGPSNPDEWGPRSELARTIYKGVDCRQCFHPTCQRGELNCMKQITGDEVFANAMKMLTVRSVEHARA